MTTIADDTNDPHRNETHHEHPKFLAHHFDTPQQQFDSGKLGLWLFLTTEICYFRGCFARTRCTGRRIRTCLNTRTCT
jgi:cytochrome c oxidase subunit 3